MLFAFPLTKGRELSVKWHKWATFAHAPAVIQKKDTFQDQKAWFMVTNIFWTTEGKRVGCTSMERMCVIFIGPGNLLWHGRLSFICHTFHECMRGSLPTEISIHIEEGVWELWKWFCTVIPLLCYMMYNKTHSKDCNLLLFEGNKQIYEKSKTAYVQLVFMFPETISTSQENIYFFYCVNQISL